MKVYTCCPHDDCGAHAGALAFLKSWGVVPTLGFDDDEGHHFLEFPVPAGDQRRPFIKALFRRSAGGVLCFCGLWHEPDAEGYVVTVRCKSCDRSFKVCTDCAPEGDGCPWCGGLRKHRRKGRRR